MAFLDNSGDIILDAVLTDLGRERLSRGDGSFNIRKFALGDDEINYELYDKNHPSGSAYYGLEVLQTPVLEAFTQNAASLKSRLISMGDSRILYLPVLMVAQRASGREDFYSGSYIIAVNENTQGNGTTVSSNALNMTTQGFFHGASGFLSDPYGITVDQGLNTLDISSTAPLNASLIESTFILEIDNRFGEIADDKGTPAAVSFVDDDNIATYLLNTSTNGRYFQNITDALDPSPIRGPRGTRLVFKVRSSINLATSDYLFTRLGSTTSLPGADGSTVSNVKFIDSNVRITGLTTGYRLDLPIRFVKSPA